MEEFGGPRFETIRNTIRKKRSQTSRRPRPESLQFPESRDRSPLSSATPSDDVGKISSDENPVGDTISRRKLFNLNQCALRETISRAGEYPLKKINKDGLSSISHRNGDFEDSFDKGGSGLKHRCRDDENQNPGYPRINGHGVENDNKVKKVKLKVGDATRTIQTKSNSHGASGSGSSTKVSRMSEAPRSHHKMILQQGNSNDDDHSPPVKKTSLRGIPWKDFSGGSSDRGVGTMPKKTAFANRGEELEPVRKSKRVPKRRVLEGAFDEEDEDDEIRYLEKLKISKAAAGSKVLEEGSSKKRQRISRVSKSDKHDEILEDFAFSKSSKDGKKKSQLEKGSEDTDYEEEEELVSDGEHEGTKKKKPKNDSIDSSIESKRGLALTTRQRALLSSKDASPGSASVVEFPNGLPPAPPRKQKEQLSEVEQQLKKAEATQRRRMQVEKAARESEAEAIRKILGQDSSRKKREDKIKKRQEEMQQEKAANALVLSSNTVRLVMGPTGTVVTFSNDMGLPSIFDPKSCSYPPPREKCSGPSCTNPYKYRDSKSKLPLCSLQCYKAIHEKMQAETTG